MKEHYYFNNAGTTWPKPEVVYTTMDRFFRNYGVNPGRSGDEMAIEAERMIVETRSLLAQFFNFSGDPNRVVFTQNATDSLNIAFFGLLKAGDHVISTCIEHNSVLRPLRHLERDHGVQVTFVGCDAQGYVDPDDIRKALTPNTRLVSVNHASNVLGSIQDLEAIGRITAEHDALLMVDTCQTAGILPIDVGALGIDILVFTGHKGLFGPMGIGGMIVADDVVLPPMRVGGTGVDSEQPFQPEDYPYHLEAGTVCLPGIAGLNAAQKWFAELGQQQLGHNGVSHQQACRAALDHIYQKEKGHGDTLMSAFQDMGGITIYGPTGNRPRVSTLSINIGDKPADQMGEMLDADYYVSVRTGLHCAPLVHEDLGTVGQKGTIRFAAGYFTDDEDIAQAIAGVKDLAEYASR
ncbi:MAG: aminotransferase class V-fold PLP-dependent enzyme [Gammaproteobacteria bacterium]